MNIRHSSQLVWQKTDKLCKLKVIYAITLAFLVASSRVQPILAHDTGVKQSQGLPQEIQSIAKSDVDHNIPRRTDSIIKIYSSNGNENGLKASKVRELYDNAYSQQVENMAVSNFFKSFLYTILAIAAVLGIITLALRLNPKKNPAKLKNVSINLPFGIGGSQWDVVPPIEQKLAWSLYVELVTRIALQSLAPDQGYLREALNSLYNLFITTRQILKEVDPAVAISPNSMGEIALKVLNQGLRPFLTKWHPILEDWEAKRPDGVSRLQHEKDWPQATEFRQELNSLRQGLEQYAQGLAKIAGIAFYDSSVMD